MSDSTFMLIATAILIVLVLVMAWAPGHVARSRNHPSAEAIALCGWLGLFLWPLWLVAAIWAHTQSNPKPRRSRGKHHLTRTQWEAVNALEDMR